MKSKITDEIKELFSQSVRWATLEMDYLKLTAAEKLSILMGAMIVGGIVMLLLLPFFIMLLFSLVGVFRLFMPAPLAYLSVGGVVMVLIILIFLLRKPLVFNPVARFITRLILGNKPSNKNPRL